MKNVSSIQRNNKNESPKTPGGISKSLLTPCRRVGLSRNWRKSCSSPFISPLTTPDSSNESKQEKESRKRKSSTIDETSQDNSQTSNNNEDLDETQISCNTPRTNTNQTPRSLLPRKKSKTLLLTKDCEEENEDIQISNVSNNENSSSITVEIKNDSPKNSKVTKLARTNSKTKFKVIESSKDFKVAQQPQLIKKGKVCIEEKISENSSIECKQKSPVDLKKECIVVLQKKIFKTDENKDNKAIHQENNPSSQVLFDSDSEDTPLSKLTKKVTSSKPFENDDDEFQESKKVKILQHKTTSTSELKTNHEPKQKSKPVKRKTKLKNPVETTIKSSQDSTDFDDDDFVSDKRTILIKKTYDKVSKLSKAKSTGSITQKDIDEVKERIESKKALLLAKAMTNETAELRNLIKKWQKGCQDALTELLELMRAKMPEQKNMEYSEILKLLKIPPDLVGYDSENDCFNTPDDANIILSDFDIK